MSDMGKITEIEPEDGLGWIEMPDGARVRFGGTACKGFVPALGMTVEVLGTKPGYGGVEKAVEVRRVRGGAPASAPKAAAASTAPRTALHTVQSSGVRADDVLLQLLGLADVSDPLFKGLAVLRFEVAPMPAALLPCPNPWFFVIARDGAGGAYGLYAHPMVANHPEAPWLHWNPQHGRLRHVASTTGQLLQDLLANAAEAGVDGAVVARARQAFVKLGMPDEPGSPIVEATADWLPPEDDALRPLAEYANESDAAEMERGLSAHAWHKQDAQAIASLQSLYEAWQWKPPTG